VKDMPYRPENDLERIGKKALSHEELFPVRITAFYKVDPTRITLESCPPISMMVRQSGNR